MPFFCASQDGSNKQRLESVSTLFRDELFLAFMRSTCFFFHIRRSMDSLEFGVLYVCFHVLLALLR